MKIQAFQKDKILEIMNAINKSNDGDISDEHIGFIQTLANFIVQMNDLRCNLEEHLNKQVSKIAPNMTSILGPLLTARMISHVGSIKNTCTYVFKHNSNNWCRESVISLNKNRSKTTKTWFIISTPVDS